MASSDSLSSLVELTYSVNLVALGNMLECLDGQPIMPGLLRLVRVGERFTKARRSIKRCL